MSDAIEKKSGKAAVPAYVQPFLDLLRQEGFRPELVGDGEDAILRFKHEGQRVRLLPDSRDPLYLWLRSSYEAPEGVDMETLLRRANRMHDDLKVIKVVIGPDRTVVLSFESDLDNFGAAPARLERGLGLLQHAADCFFRDLRDEKGKPQGEQAEASA